MIPLDTGYDPTIAIAELFVTFLLFIIPLIAIISLGGPKEAFFRIFRVKYFAHIHYDSDREARRTITRSVEIQTHSPSYFDWSNKRWYIDSLNTERYHGRPQWRYVGNNSFPLPSFTMDRQSVDAEAIRKAFNSKQLQDYLHARERGAVKEESHLTRNIALLGLVIVMIIVLIVGFHI